MQLFLGKAKQQLAFILCVKRFVPLGCLGKCILKSTQLNGASMND
jgi:hypothetical protein